MGKVPFVKNSEEKNDEILDVLPELISIGPFEQYPVSIKVVVSELQARCDTLQFSYRELSEIVARFLVERGYNVHFDAAGDKFDSKDRG